MEDDAARSDAPGLEPGGPVEEAPAEAPLPDAPTAEQTERAEALIRQANLARIRGDKDGYQKLLEEAAAAAPGSSAVHEALGDSYIERKQVRKAMESFRMAVRLDPGNASAERKFGEAVLAIQIAIDPGFALASDDGSFASGKAAAILSFLVPGLGQIVSGASVTGAVILAVWVLGLIWAMAVPDGLSGIPTLFGRGNHAFNGAVLVPLFFMAAAWIAGVADASSKAKRVVSKKIERPTPPVDKKFEI